MSNTVIENMKTRRSVRKYKTDMVPQELIDQIAEAGIHAASGMNRQETIVVTITDRAVRDRLAEDNRRIGGWKEGFDPFYGAPVVCVVLAEKSAPTYLYDGTLTLGNMLLAAHSLGVDSCWIHRAKEEFEMPEWKEWLKSIGIEGDYEGIGHCILGYADGSYPAPIARNERRTFQV